MRNHVNSEIPLVKVTVRTFFLIFILTLFLHLNTDFIRQPDTFKLVRFVARIVEWTEDNIFAKGQVICVLQIDCIDFSLWPQGV